jgi:hypothetical protein
MKTAQQRQATASNVRLPIDDRLDELRQQRDGVRQEKLALETLGTRPAEALQAANFDQEALALLDKDAKIVAAPVGPSASVRLHELENSLRKIDRAIELGGQRWAADHAARSRELIAEHSAEWAAAQRQRASILIDLMKANRSVEDLKQAMTSQGQLGGNLPLDGFTGRLFGTGGAQTPVNHWVYEYLKAAVAIGLIDAKDFRDV